MSFRSLLKAELVFNYGITFKEACERFPGISRENFDLIKYEYRRDTLKIKPNGKKKSKKRDINNSIVLSKKKNSRPLDINIDFSIDPDLQPYYDAIFVKDLENQEQNIIDNLNHFNIRLLLKIAVNSNNDDRTKIQAISKLNDICKETGSLKNFLKDSINNDINSPGFIESFVLDKYKDSKPKIEVNPDQLDIEYNVEE